MNLTIAQHRVVIIAALAMAGAILFFPAQRFFQQRHDIAQLQTSLANLHNQDVELAAESKRLQDPNELALLARQRLGLVKPGERAYFIEPTSPPKQVVAERPVHHSNVFGRAWHWLTTHLRGRH